MTKNQILVILKVIVSGGLIWFLLSSIDIGAAKDRILGADNVMILCAGFVLLLQMGVGGARWWAVMRAIETPLPWFELTKLFWIGGFFSQALPSSVGGDPIRIYMAYKDGLPLSKAINGVMLERVVTIIGLTILVIAVQPWFVPKLNAETQMLTLTVLAMLGAGTIFGVIVLLYLDRLPEALSKFRIVRGMNALAADSRLLFLRLKGAVLASIFGILTHVNISLCVFFLAMSIGVDVTWLDCMVLMPLVILVTTLPISIAGWGVREGAMVTAFALVGVPGEGALVLSLMLGILGIVMMIPGGGFWLIRRKAGEAMSAADAEAAVEQELENTMDASSKNV
jgi:glycosyltransferase 2 family protein